MAGVYGGRLLCRSAMIGREEVREGHFVVQRGQRGDGVVRQQR